MPYAIQKKGRCFQVINKETERVAAKCTSKENAQKQVRLLRGVESGKWKPASSYKEFVSQQFKKRPAGVAAKDYMKQVAAKWRQIKGKGMMMESEDSSDEMCGSGPTLLLSPGLGATKADYVGAGSTLLLSPGLGVTSAAYTRD